MDDIINQIVAIISTWKSAGIVTALVLLVNLLTNLTKLQALQNLVPPAVRPWIALALGSVGTTLAALTAGKPLLPAVFAGLLFGLGAIGTHELVSSLRPSAQTVIKSPQVTAVVLVLVLLSIHGCGSECREPAKASTLACSVRNNAIDCTKQEIAPTVAAFLPMALAYVGKLTGVDGSIDWVTFAMTLASNGRADAVCIYDKTVAQVTKQSSAPAIQSLLFTPQIDPIVQRQAADAARLAMFGTVHTILE